MCKATSVCTKSGSDVHLIEVNGAKNAVCWSIGLLNSIRHAPGTRLFFERINGCASRSGEKKKGGSDEEMMFADCQAREIAYHCETLNERHIHLKIIGHTSGPPLKIADTRIVARKCFQPSNRCSSPALITRSSLILLPVRGILSYQGYTMSRGTADRRKIGVTLSWL